MKQEEWRKRSVSNEKSLPISTRIVPTCWWAFWWICLGNSSWVGHGPWGHEEQKQLGFSFKGIIILHLQHTERTRAAIVTTWNLCTTLLSTEHFTYFLQWIFNHSLVGRWYCLHSRDPEVGPLTCAFTRALVEPALSWMPSSTAVSLWLQMAEQPEGSFMCLRCVQVSKQGCAAYARCGLLLEVCSLVNVIEKNMWLDMKTMTK